MARFHSYEDVTHLLVHGHLPTPDESKQFMKRMIELRNIGEQDIDSILSEFGSIQGSFTLDSPEVLVSIGLKRFIEKLDFYKDDHGLSAMDTALLFVSMAPVVVAAEWRKIHGKIPITSRNTLGHSTNFLWMLNETTLDDLAARELETSMILHMDDPDNPSLSALESTYRSTDSVSKATLAALDKHVSTLHHGAGTEAMRMIKEIGGHPQVSNLLEYRLGRGEKIFGLGHRIYRSMDPRAKVLREILKRRGEEDTRWAKRLSDIDEIAEVGSGLILEKKGKAVHPNVDLYNAAVYESFGISYLLNTDLFAIARSAGWAAHILELQ
ncbi:MAG: citrate/2-methylcitrate synthase [Candidatus Thorarchaeota archaeon]